LLHLVKDVHAAAKQYFTIGRQLGALRSAVQQSHAERALNFGYRLGDRGMGNSQFGGRLRHAAGVGDRHQDMKVAQLDTAANSIRPIHREP